ncbi:MAG: zinc-binding dehydrogenase [Bdellovibrio sp.]|nr:zinc-binding dehydrogenase [Bdellovibrio sp.]
MKAWLVEKHGGPEVLSYKEIPTPIPGPSQVRVSVRAVGINHMDIWVRNGVTGHTFPLPLIPGCDITGVIDQFGPGSEEKAKQTGLTMGASVIINPILSCGTCQVCLNSNETCCPQIGLIGETKNGGCAEFIVIPISNIIPCPKNISFEEGAAIPITFITAWNMLCNKTKLKPEELVLIQAGASGVSVAAIQIAKLLGGTVITTVGDEEKMEKAKNLGADFIINYKKKSFREEVKKISLSLGKKGVDVALDHIGGETFQETLKCLDWGGRVAFCGATANSKIEIDLKPLFFKNISLFGTTMGSKDSLNQIIDLIKQKKLKAVIDSVFKMSKYKNAIFKLESRNFFGKIIVRV